MRIAARRVCIQMPLITGLYQPSVKETPSVDGLTLQQLNHVEYPEEEVNDLPAQPSPEAKYPDDSDKPSEDIMNHESWE